MTLSPHGEEGALVTSKWGRNFHFPITSLTATEGDGLITAIWMNVATPDMTFSNVTLSMGSRYHFVAGEGWNLASPFGLD